MSMHSHEDDLRRLREAIRSALRTPQEGFAPPDPAWREAWPALAELGLTGFCVSEARGGYGFEVEAAVVAAQELGAALHGSAYAGLVASAHALGASDAAIGHELVEDILAGRRICAFGALAAPRESLVGDLVTGTARLVGGVPGADSLLLAFQSSAELVLVLDAGASRIEPLAAAFDESRPCGDVHLERTPVVPLASTSVWPLYRLLLAADTVGGVQRILDQTVDYARTRRAFGRAIGGFQAVQHRLVDHTIRVRGMMLVVEEAARTFAEGSSGGERAVALAELIVSEGAVHVLHDLLQLTGAIGFTWEHGLHRYERRAHHDARLVGNPRAAVRALAHHEKWTR